MIDFKLKRLERLRKLKNRDGMVPNFKAKLSGVRLLDQVLEVREIKLPDCEALEETPPIQKPEGMKRPPRQKPEGMTITVTDVAALFPSITDVEVGRIIREAVEESTASIENVDYRKALRYLTICGAMII